MPHQKHPDDYEGPDRRLNEPWHFDRRVPISLIIFMMLQTASFIWYGAKQDSRIQTIAEKVDTMEIWKETQNGTASKTESRLAVIEERTSEQSETLRRIDERLEKMLVFRAPASK